MTRTAEKPQVLLAHHLKVLKLPTFLAEYERQARESAAEGIDHPRYLLRLTELELIERERRLVDRRIRAAKFPATKSLDTVDFLSIPALNKMLVLELARSEYVIRNDNVIALGPSGTGKTHVGLGLAACQKGFSVLFTSTASLVNRLMEARDNRQLTRLQAQLAAVKLLIVDELGYVPLSPTGALLLFEVFSQRYERGSTIVTSNLPFEEWTSVLGSERLTRDPARGRSRAPDGRPARPRRGRRNRRAAPDRCLDTPSSPAPVDDHPRATESRFAANLNRVLQQNRPIAHPFIRMTRMHHQNMGLNI
jgi:DNA replication protein DnaC